MPRTRAQFRLFDLVMVVVLAAFLIAFARQLPQTLLREDVSLLTVFTTILSISVTFGIWYTIWTSARARRTGPVCENCGRRFNPLGQPAKSKLCPRCRYQSLPRAQAQNQQLVGWVIIVTCVMIVMVLIGLPFWNRLVARAGVLSWILYPLLVFCAALGWLATCFIAIVIFAVIRNWRLQFEKPVLARARKCARDEGAIARLGPLTIWWSGPADPAPLVTQKLESMRQSFERLVDQPVDTQPLRVLVFHERRAFIAFHRKVVAENSEIECLYSGRPVRLLTLTTETPRFRAIEDSGCLRAGFVLYLLETLRGSLSSHWLQSGLSAALSSDPSRSTREQLLRRMKVAFHNGTTSKAPAFFSRLSVFQARELMGPLVDHGSFALYAQWRAQSHSVIEYLAGSDAPPDRLARFRSFLCDLKAAPSEEPVFKRHFDHGFDALLEHWQAWVTEQSLGNDPIPPPEVRVAITERLVPVIADRSKKAYDRILAMRALGTAAYVLGAHTLIDVLREQDDRFTPTATWALESIAGLPLGSDADRWSDWWSNCETDVRGDLEHAEPSAAAAANAPAAPL
jgi:hypothetical protein